MESLLSERSTAQHLGQGFALGDHALWTRNFDQCWHAEATRRLAYAASQPGLGRSSLGSTCRRGTAPAHQQEFIVSQSTSGGGHRGNRLQSGGGRWRRRRCKGRLPLARRIRAGDFSCKPGLSRRGLVATSKSPQRRCVAAAMPVPFLPRHRRARPGTGPPARPPWRRRYVSSRAWRGRWRSTS